MVKRREHAHHGMRGDGVIQHDNGPAHSPSKATDNGLWRIDVRRTDVDGEHTHIGDSAGAAALLVRQQGLGLGPGGEIPYLPADLTQAQLIRILDDRDHQAILRAYCHREVDMLVSIKRLAVEGGVCKRMSG